MVGGAVIDSLTRRIHHRNHICGVFGNEPKQFVMLRELAANSLKLQMLINRIDIEQQNESSQAANTLGKIKPIKGLFAAAIRTKRKKDDSSSQCQRYGYGKNP